MTGTVDSELFVFAGRDPERIGEPTEVNEATRMEWLPLASLPGLIGAGEIWDAGSLLAVPRLLVPGRQSRNTSCWNHRQVRGIPTSRATEGA